MLRFPAVFCKTKTFYISRLKHRPEIQTSVTFSQPLVPLARTYKKFSDKERETYPPPPPPPCKVKPLNKYLWGTFTLMLLTGGCAAYCKQSPEIRDWLTINLPWFDDLIAVLYQENMSYWQFILCVLREADAQFKDFMEMCVLEKKKLEELKIDPKAEEIVEEIKYDSCGLPLPPPEKVEEGGTLTPETSECENVVIPLPPPILNKDLCNMEFCIRELADTIISNYYTAKGACTVYNREVRSALRDYSHAKFKKLRNARETRQEMLDVYQTKAEEAVEMLKHFENEMLRAVTCVEKCKKDPSSVERTMEVLKDLKDRIFIIKAEFEWNLDRALAYDASILMTEQSVDRYIEEIKSVYEVEYCQPRPKITEDMDYLLHHTKRYGEYLRKILNEQLEYVTEKADRAIELLPEEDRGKVQEVYKKISADLEKDEKDYLEELKEVNEKETKCMLEAAEEKFQRELDAKLDELTNEITERFNKMVAEALALKKQEFNEILKEMSIKLRAAQDQFNARIKSEHERARSRALYEAALALMAKCKSGEPKVTVIDEIEAIERHRGFCDEFLLAILNGIPEVVRRKGIVPESTIRDRYVNVEDIAMKVSMVESEGSPLLIYGISLAQYFLLCLKLSSIPQEEIDKPPEEPFNGMDTFDLLQRARYYMDHNRLDRALPYINALKGASRGVADIWYDDAKNLLEIRQVAEAVLAHASAMGVKYI